MAKITRPLSKNSIPVIVVAGFLGAGKTTLLNHVLKNALGARIAVIVNDFGSVNIDALLITARTDQKLELTNGCVCCSATGDELDEALGSALLSDPDVIIIEASGLAEPEDIARLILLHPDKRIGYGGLVYIVDALNFEVTLKKHERLMQHIRQADLLVLTKSEQLTSRESGRIFNDISAATDAPIVPIENGEIAPGLLFDIPARQAVQPLLLQQDHPHTHLHDHYGSLLFETSQPINYEKFRQFMRALPEGVYRVKGWVYFGAAGYEQKYGIQAVGERWDMYREEWAENERPQTTLVLIGIAIDDEKILQHMNSLIGEGDQLIDLERYSV